ncbi:surface attachment protein Sap1 [Paraburkholderia sp.]|uniref:surface attachment protein Sap1 n=1 Tax=Paraburkholderia sp. TaxID=1926495 RepID=UPI0039E663F2
MKTRIAVIFAVAGLAAASVQAQDVMIKPQQTIQFKANAYGCVSKDKLDAVDHHAQAGEQQQMQEFFSGYQCVSTPADSNFRVVRVVGHDVEFVNAGNSDTEGLWANDRFIKQ